MSAGQAISALMLVCSGNPSAGGSEHSGGVAFFKLPVSEAMMNALRLDPPVSKLTFVGEDGPQREWIIGGRSDPTTGKMTIIRLRKSNDPLSPFAFDAGKAVQNEAGLSVYASEATGKCDLRPAATNSESHD